MGLYSRVIFPRILHFAMSGEDMREIRAGLLEGVSGKVFEIGFGTGLNLRHYPDAVTDITTVDVNPGMNALARRAIEKSSIPVEHKVLNGEQLPMADEAFDNVVCTWTLCSIENVEDALREVRRVLKPGGRFFFAEHGLADDPKTQKWQHRLNPIQRIVGDGCNLNRNVKELIQDSHFAFESYDNFALPKVPRAFGYMYRGVAVKA